jgi:hypothetical protein
MEILLQEVVDEGQEPLAINSWLPLERTRKNLTRQRAAASLRCTCAKDYDSTRHEIPRSVLPSPWFAY